MSTTVNYLEQLLLLDQFYRSQDGASLRGFSQGNGSVLTPASSTMAHSSSVGYGGLVADLAPAADFTFELTLLALVRAVFPAILVLLYLLASTGLPQHALSILTPRSWRGLLDEFVTDEDVRRMQEEERKEREGQEKMGAKVQRGTEELALAPAPAPKAATTAGVEGEAEANESTHLLYRGNGGWVNPANPLAPTDCPWPAPKITLGLTLVSLLHICAHLALLCYQLTFHPSSSSHAHVSPSDRILTPADMREILSTQSLILLSWSYVLIRTLFAPQRTPPRDTFALLVVFLLGAILQLHYTLASAFASVWRHQAGTYGFVNASRAVGGAAGESVRGVAGNLVLECVSLASLLWALWLVGTMPIAVFPSSNDFSSLSPEQKLVLSDPMYTLYAPERIDVDASKLSSPEDTCTLFHWLTFRWVASLLRATRKGKLDETDVWQLSRFVKSRVLIRKWNEYRVGSGSGSNKEKASGNLALKIFRTNSKDMIIDFSLTIVSSTLGYAKPFFLKRILEAIEAERGGTKVHAAAGDYMQALSAHKVYAALVKGGPEHTSKETAYLFALLAFLAVVLESQTDLYHLYAGRRAATRVRSELMASIYEKGMKGKSVSGLVEKDEKKANTVPKAGAKKPVAGSVAENNAAGAAVDKDEQDQNGQGVGRVVSLMAVDATRIANFVAMLTMLYGAPTELIIALAFLYNILGWSAFAGLVALLVATPLQSICTRIGVRLSKRLSNIRDSRMTALNEYISNLKMIKLVAWEGNFVRRILEVRHKELNLLFQRQVINSCMSFLWTIAPSSVSVLAFASYTLIEGKPLTISVAFTALNLYVNLAGPLNVIPLIINEAVTVYVCCDRVEKFLDGEEIEDRISTLHKPVDKAIKPLTENVSCKNATFRWSLIAPAADKEKRTNNSFVTRLQGLTRRIKLWGRSSGAPSMSATTASDGATGEADEEEHPRKPFELANVTMSCEPGLTLVFGPTGSGKSSLLNALLGEMDLIAGNLHLPKLPGHYDPSTGLNGGIAYCAQQPWLQQRSIRENILFGSPFEKERYEQVLEICALNPDLAIFEEGDLQEVGEGGISLSGGQKARLALARCVYSRARTCLLDDVLSAVDSHTAELLVNSCLQGPLMKNRCVVLATHHVELVLPIATCVIKINKGAITASGSPQELRAAGELEDLPTLFNDEDDTEGSAVKLEGAKSQDASVKLKIGAEDAKATRKLVEKEERATGSVKWSIYSMYLKACGYHLLGLAVFCIILAKVINTSAQLWLSYWAQSNYKERSAPGTLITKVYQSSYSPFVVKAYSQLYDATSKSWLPPAAQNPAPYILVYGGIQLSEAVVLMMMVIITYAATLRASRLLFARMLDSVSKATSRWIDKTPSGRILNRFARDVEVLDSTLLTNVRTVVQYSINLLGSILILAVSLPAFIVPAALLSYLYITCAIGYVRASRDLRRIESVTRSPIFQGYGEALKGIVTIRAFTAETRLIQALYQDLDTTTSCLWFWWMCNRWLLLRLDCLGGLNVLFSTLLSLSGAISPGVAAIAITQSNSFSMSMYWLSRQWSTLEQDLNSVERVNEYLPPGIPQEAPAIIEENRPPAAWPTTKAGVRFQNVVLRYDSTLEPVLRGVSFEIKAGEKIGLVGRTGSGKSTLATALLRFAELSEGKIFIDNIDISTIGVNDLRSRLSLIPQDPILFNGTIRENLDPFRSATDEQCLEVLARVNLTSSPSASRTHSRGPSRPASTRNVSTSSSDAANTIKVNTNTEASMLLTASHHETIEHIPKASLTLDSKVSEGGGNLSQGQRQLLAMARAMLRDSRIVIADEATASIDFQTDQQIQRAIREHFTDHIMLVIAHRLTTIASFDRVLVLDNGKVVEFDSPKNLLENSEGHFYKMCKHSGDFDTLQRMANEPHPKINVE
ncbi:hypothetical protein K437DRAFT_158415 [Tilletiaria anomala UBC 951]|uniref:P-loop containing nucleoside triphosphate hydrolase protein n=1 Tax=Tilletiaria anomala (strain ATCC 24038 / CBS 436.72 / UBC 951) TaxID=1037660 RepID=A0A066VQP2_TILAU|nr:uncharacterized protein K437DRAFT_158415 [Tilletiaria anomala UBC 951]KDN42598.1 hypothetical protein K437DRAFT_158415 [Tilletiaria anomala UBC 951]